MRHVLTLFLLLASVVPARAQSAITLVEYGDYQCPACAWHHPHVKRLMAEFGDRIRFEFRHFPLPNHSLARPAAQAAEAARLQGRFDVMHDYLMSDQEDWTSGDPLTRFTAAAVRFGMDAERFRADFASERVAAAVDRDLMAGQALNLRSVPSFFINGTLISNGRSYEDWRRIIRAHLAE